MRCLSLGTFIRVTVAISLATLALVATMPAFGQSAVLSDQDLMEWARDTYSRSDWIYAAIHMNALIQRNPPLLRDNPVLATQVSEGLKYSVEQLQQYKAKAGACPTTGSNPNGVSSVSSGLTSAPPRVDFPK